MNQRKRDYKIDKFTSKKVGVAIFLTSFLILFLELALIRFLPAQITYFGYYSNFILLASFVGIGIGMLKAGDGRNLIWYLPWVLLFLIVFTSFFAFSIYPDPQGELHFYSHFNGIVLPEILLIPFIFFLVSCVFALLSQYLGKMLNILPPLNAYTWDILGSILGIVIFSVFSYFRTSPIVWFSVFAVIVLFLLREKTLRWIITCFVFVLMIAILFPLVAGTIWSPYQKITTLPSHNPNAPYEVTGHTLFVNNIAHQFVTGDINQLEWVYKIPYEIFNTNHFKSTLIIGAGTGNDVAMALRYSDWVDAVEIDPEIYLAGVKLHPNKPYQDSRVRIYIDDARSFLEKNKTKYDLIIFALPDSLILASSHGNIRLESFLFTKESFLSAKQHLSNDGAILLYNYYRKPWLVAKLSGMLDEVFGKKTYVIADANNDQLAVLVNGDKLNDLKGNIQKSSTFGNIPPPASDSWPFLYLQKPSLPSHYLLMLGLILTILYLFLTRSIKQHFYKIIEPTYFFLGAGFLLLETKSIIQFSLLFGATWVTNALVFFAILTLVLLAVQIAARISLKNPLILYLVLAAALLAQFVFPIQSLLSLNPSVKYFLVSLITFAPIFIANIIFACTFKHSKNNAVNFASNILGAALGGVLEYSALLIGYHYLVIVIMFCYLLAFLIPYILAKKSQKILN